MHVLLEQLGGRHPAARAGQPDALRHLSLALEAGEQVAVIGPSGAGKTTLLHLLACALAPSSGRLQLDDCNPWLLPRRELQRLRGTLLLAPQTPPLPPRQRVVTAVLAARLPQIGLWSSLRSLLYPSDIPAAEAALARFDLADKLFERVDRLSGGERQRVSLARALLALGPAPAAGPTAPGARLLLLDEPLSALDPTRAQQALLALTQAARSANATLVATLHHVDLALQHFPRIIGLRHGELMFDLAAGAVTPAQLQALYAQHLDELHEPVGGPASEPPAEPTAPAPYCR